MHRNHRLTPGQAPDESWSIPIRIRAEVGGEIRTERILLIDETEVDLGANASRVQVNVDGIGFFRSSYDDGLLQALATDPDAGPLERFVLIDDMSAALNAGRLDHAEMWRIIDIVARSEMHPAVWRRLGAAIRELGRLVGPDKDGRTATGVNSATENALGWVKSVLMEGDVDADSSLASKAQELRGLIVGLRGTIGSNDHVREHARIVFGASGDLPIAIDASLQAAAIEVVAYTATPDEHQELQRRWRQASTPQEELRYLTALVDTDSPELFADALDLALSEVRTQNAPYLLQRAIAHRCLAPQAWSFVASNWESITQRFPSNSLARMLAGIRSTTDRELATTMAHDIEAFELPSGRQQLDQHLERMWVTVAAAERVRG
ncbi:MAG: ERAP1-like C-terminal domain-containing protein [Microthrixaceae bacterium]